MNGDVTRIASNGPSVSSPSDDRLVNDTMFMGKGMGTIHAGIETETAPPPRRATSDKPGHGTGRHG